MKRLVTISLLTLFLSTLALARTTGESVDSRNVKGVIWTSTVKKLVHRWDGVLTRRVYQSSGDPVSRFLQTGGWINYSSDTGRFSILMPAQPKVSEQPVDSAVGKLTNYIFMVQSSSTAFAISYADYPQNETADPQAVLDGVRAGAIKGIKGTLISGKNITHKNYHGREFQASMQGLLYTSRIFLVNNRLYQMVVVAPPGAASTAIISKFLTSFDLKLNEQ